MKKENLSLVLENISSDHIEEAMHYEAEANRHSPKKSWTHWGALAAACFILLVCLIPVMHSLEWNPPIVGSTTKNPSFTTPPESYPSQTTKPDDAQTPSATPPLSVDYPTLEAVHGALGYATLYENLALDRSDTTNISVLYDFSYAKPGDESIENYGSPRQMCIKASYTKGNILDQVEYYVIFGSDHVDDSYIDGYTEQNRQQKIGEVTVHYAVYKRGSTLHSHAKFVYAGNLYVIRIQSHGYENVTVESAPSLPYPDSPLFFYLDPILGQTEQNQ